MCQAIQQITKVPTKTIAKLVSNVDTAKVTR